MLCFHWNKPGKAEGEKKKLGAVMLFPKVFFQADLFSSCCILLQEGRFWMQSLIQGDHIVLPLLNCDVSWAIWHRSGTGRL